MMRSRHMVTLGATALILATSVAASTAGTSSPERAVATPTCFGVAATIVGTSGRDHLTGTPDRDVIAGLGGRDVIDGRGGDDVICGGNGGDLLRGDGGGLHSRPRRTRLDARDFSARGLRRLARRAA